MLILILLRVTFKSFSLDATVYILQDVLDDKPQFRLRVDPTVQRPDSMRDATVRDVSEIIRQDLLLYSKALVQE